MTRAKTPEPFSSSTRGRYAVETVTYFNGTAELYGPTSQPPFAGCSVEHVTCGHRHTDPEAAEKCGLALGKREAARRNAEAQPERAAVRPIVRGCSRGRTG